MQQTSFWKLCYLIFQCENSFCSFSWNLIGTWIKESFQRLKDAYEITTFIAICTRTFFSVFNQNSLTLKILMKNLNRTFKIPPSFLRFVLSWTYFFLTLKVFTIIESSQGHPPLKIFINHRANRKRQKNATVIDVFPFPFSELARQTELNAVFSAWRLVCNFH